MRRDPALAFSGGKRCGIHESELSAIDSTPDYKMLNLIAAAYLRDKPGSEPAGARLVRKPDVYWCVGSYVSQSIIHLDPTFLADTDLLDQSSYLPDQLENWKCDILSWIEGVHPQAGEGSLDDFIMEILPAPFCASAHLGANADALDLTFQELAETWERETAVLSSITMMSIHPAYQRIIGMGSRVLPLIFRELARRPGHWFWALNAITGEDPVPPEGAGDIQRMTESWLEFGRQRGYI